MQPVGSAGCQCLLLPSIYSLRFSLKQPAPTVFVLSLIIQERSTLNSAPPLRSTTLSIKTGVSFRETSWIIIHDQFNKGCRGPSGFPELPVSNQHVGVDGQLMFPVVTSHQQLIAEHQHNRGQHTSGCQRMATGGRGEFGVVVCHFQLYKRVFA